MTRRAKVWRPVALVAAVLFVLVNLGGAPIAAVRGELWHTALHVGLVLVGAYAVRRLAPSRNGGDWRRAEAAGSSAQPHLSDRLTRLERSVDAVALEVERIGEGQRFVTRTLAEQRAARAAGTPVGRA